jgi:hypothetical protein
MKSSRVIGVRRFWIVIFLATAPAWATAQNGQRPDIRALMEQLSNPREVRADTVKQIVTLSKKDPSAREYVVQKLPDMIRGPKSDLWLDAIRLAGELKAEETISALLDVMSRPPSLATTTITFAGITRLDTDIVAKALSQIGDPAIPAVTSLLRSKDSRMRGRAILILRNIGSTAARKILEEHRSQESDPENLKLIGESLRP